MLKSYPEFSEIAIELRPLLHPLFQNLPEGISEFTFANLYLFRETHNYKIAGLNQNLFVIIGRDDSASFFMLPFGLPEKDILEELFEKFDYMKLISELQARQLVDTGYVVEEDRDNFDYLYSREELSKLAGRKFHKKKNLINYFTNNFQYEGKPLLEDYREEALELLRRWRDERDNPGDYEAAKEALEKMWDLQLCGGIYHVDGKPAGYSLGEELARGKSFVIHFEKAVNVRQHKGLYQFINQAFASILPEKYDTINREQDLGDKGLRHAKKSYNPIGFIKKYRAKKR